MLPLSSFGHEKRDVALALLKLATNILPSSALKCAIPIVDLVWKDVDAVQLPSVREALSEIPIEVLSTVLTRHYQGSVPTDLFEDLKSRPAKHQGCLARLKDLPPHRIHVIFALLGGSRKDLDRDLVQTTKLVEILLKGEGGVLSKTFFSNLTDISSSNDELNIDPEHLEALKGVLECLTELPPLSDTSCEAILAKIVRDVVQIVHTCPTEDLIDKWSHNDVRRWLREVEAKSSLYGSRCNSLASPIIQILKHHFEAAKGKVSGSESRSGDLLSSIF